MSHFPGSDEQPTAPLVLVAVAVLGLAAALSLPSPFFSGLLLVPAYCAAAILGYRGVRWAPALGFASAGIAMFVALIAVAVAFAQPTAGTTMAGLLRAVLMVVCALLGGAGSVALMVVRPRPSGVPGGGVGVPGHGAVADGAPTAPGDGSQAAPRKSGVRESAAPEDLRRAGQAAATGARAAMAGGAAAWRAHRRRATVREQRAAEHAASHPGYFSNKAMVERKRGREDAEIRKAQLLRARRENGRR
ncbi:hypothetical protein [Brachybacterium sp. AOP3-A1-3]|uniref:hypothetical protein n=1 Tax=Brachybacterium sp. AOP3-A1-3 TaxID=3457699 RepID=UPI00403316AE